MSAIDDCREMGLLPEEVDGLRSPSGMFYTDHRNMVALESLAAVVVEQKARADDAEHKLVELARVSQNALRYDNETMARDGETVISLSSERYRLKAMLREAYRQLDAAKFQKKTFSEWLADLVRRSGGEA